MIWPEAGGKNVSVLLLLFFDQRWLTKEDSEKPEVE